MRKLLYFLVVCLIAFASYGAAPAVIGTAGGVEGGAPTCTEPNGDLYTEGFEGTGYELGACGSGECWSESGSPDEDYALSGLSGGAGDSTRNCDTGLQAVGSGSSVYSNWAEGTQVTEAWWELSFYVDSHSLGVGAFAPIACLGQGEGCSGILTRLELSNPGGTFSIRANGLTSSSTDRAISIDTWYYVRLYMSSGSSSCSLTVGTTYGGTDIANGDTYDCNVRTANDSWTIGVISSQTLTVIFGYSAGDDDGTF